MKRNRFNANFSVIISLLLSSPLGAQVVPGGAGDKPDDAATTMEIFEVRSSKDVGYRSTQTISGSRTVENLRDTPLSISVLNRDPLDWARVRGAPAASSACHFGPSSSEAPPQTVRLETTEYTPSLAPR